VVENFYAPVHLFEHQQGLRVINGRQNFLYNIWDSENVECYDMNKDPYQLDNKCSEFSDMGISSNKWKEIVTCQGVSCRELQREWDNSYGVLQTD